MRTCNVKGCRSTNDFNNTTLYQLPENGIKRKQWLKLMGLENVNYTTKLVFICSRHFQELSIDKTLNPKRLKDNGTQTGTSPDLLKSERLSDSNSDLLQMLTEENAINNVKSEIMSELNLDPLHTPTEDDSINMKSERLSESNSDLIHISDEDIVITNVKSESELNSDVLDYDIPTEDIAPNDVVKYEEMVPYKNTLEGGITHIIASKPQCLISDLQLTPEHVVVNANVVRGQVANPVETGPSIGTKKTSDSLKDFQYNKIITKLKTKCEKQHKKIKSLQGQLRRNQKKITKYEDVIEKLKENYRIKQT